MRFGAAILAWLLIVGVCAAEGAGALAPLPRAAPLAPGSEPAVTVNDQDRVLRALDAATRQRDERIQAILHAAAGVRPVTGTDLGPGLVQPRADRDQALADLRTALDDYLGRTHRVEPDVLDAHGATRQNRQLGPLSAANRIAIAECIKQLCAEERGDDRRRRLDEGLAEILALPAEVADDLRPRAIYMQVWFLSELARQDTDQAARADHVARARAAASGFTGTFADSDLAPVVTQLVADLPSAGATSP